MKRFRHLLKTTGPYLAALGILVLLRSTGLAQTLDLVIYDLITSQRSEGSGQDQPITLSAGSGEPRADLSRRNTRLWMHLLPRRAKDLTKEALKAIVNHLEIARIKYDTCRIAVPKENLLLNVERHRS